ncbi:hypothetical protein JCM30237_26560 [Halolamina litorea]
MGAAEVLEVPDGVHPLAVLGVEVEVVVEYRRVEFVHTRRRGERAFNAPLRRESGEAVAAAVGASAIAL